MHVANMLSKLQMNLWSVEYTNTNYELPEKFEHLFKPLNTYKQLEFWIWWLDRLLKDLPKQLGTICHLPTALPVRQLRPTPVFCPLHDCNKHNLKMFGNIIWIKFLRFSPPIFRRGQVTSKSSDWSRFKNWKFNCEFQNWNNYNFGGIMECASHQVSDVLRIPSRLTQHSRLCLASLVV